MAQIRVVLIHIRESLTIYKKKLRHEFKQIRTLTCEEGKADRFHRSKATHKFTIFNIKDVSAFNDFIAQDIIASTRRIHV